MKTVTVQLPDEVYERAERRAAERGVSLPDEIAAYLRHFSEGAAPRLAANGDDERSVTVRQLFAALDAGRNVRSVSPVMRDEFYDRPILH